MSAPRNTPLHIGLMVPINNNTTTMMEGDLTAWLPPGT